MRRQAQLDVEAGAVCGETARHRARQLCQIHLGALHLEPASLDARGVEQIADQMAQPIGLVLDGGQAHAQSLGFPMRILAGKRRGVALDDGDGGLQLVRDDGDKGAAQLFGLARARDVAHVQDGADGLALRRAHGGGADGDVDALPVARQQNQLVVGHRLAGRDGLHQRVAPEAERVALRIVRLQDIVVEAAENLV